MTDRPILFSGPMVRALLAGTKTQTRRIVKPQPTWDASRDEWTWQDRNGTAKWTGDRPVAAALVHGLVPACPYGQPGDRLWVRETLRLRHDGERSQTWWLYTADGQIAGGSPSHSSRPPKRNAVPSIHMPRWASRITLEITGVRVERLQAISGDDAEAEGVDLAGCTGECGKTPCHNAIPQYRKLWESINGHGSWDANPWVWVVEFKRGTP